MVCSKIAPIRFRYKPSDFYKALRAEQNQTWAKERCVLSLRVNASPYVYLAVLLVCLGSTDLSFCACVTAAPAQCVRD